MAKKKTRKRAGGAKRRRSSGARSLSGVSVEALRAELDRRLGDLEARRSDLTAELEEVEEEIASIGASVGVGTKQRSTGGARRGRPRSKPRKKTAAGGRRGGGRRPRNDMNLVDALSGVLKNKTLGVTEMSEAVQKAGYKTSSPNFRTIVNQTLIKNPDRFKRVARGQYTAK